MTDAPAYDSLSESERCELLARVMGWTAPAGDAWLPPSGAAKRGFACPNPFTSAADYRALRLWADDQGYELATHIKLTVPSELQLRWVRPAGGTSPNIGCRRKNYDAECRAVIKALGLVLGIWL